MKKLLFLIILVFALSSCTTTFDTGEYDSCYVRTYYVGTPPPYWYNTRPRYVRPVPPPPPPKPTYRPTPPPPKPPMNNNRGSMGGNNKRKK